MVYPIPATKIRGRLGTVSVYISPFFTPYFLWCLIELFAANRSINSIRTQLVATIKSTHINTSNRVNRKARLKGIIALPRSSTMPKVLRSIGAYQSKITVMTRTEPPALTFLRRIANGRKNRNDANQHDSENQSPKNYLFHFNSP